MNILITGASGFLGSHLAELAIAEGHSVTALIRPDSDLWRISHLLNSISTIEADPLDFSKTKKEISNLKPDTVFHLGWAGVQSHEHNDILIVRNNLQSTLDLIDASKTAQVKTWIGVGSQSEYGPQNCILREDSPTNPTTAYGAAKLAVHTLARQLVESSGMRFVWLRLFSSYGPKDNLRWFIPYVISSLLSGKSPQISAGEQVWDYIYVADAAEALLLSAKLSNVRGMFNLGSGKTNKIKDVAAAIQKLINPDIPILQGRVPLRADQISHLQADITRLHQATGWLPKTELIEGLSITIDWYRTHHTK